MRHERKHAFRWSKRKRKEKETKVKKCVVFVLCFNWMKQTRIPLCSICFVSIQLKHNTSQHITRFQGVKRGVKRNEEKWKGKEGMKRVTHAFLLFTQQFTTLLCQAVWDWFVCKEDNTQFVVLFVSFFFSRHNKCKGNGMKERRSGTNP